LDYVDWVEKVLHATDAAWNTANENNRSVLGVTFEEVTESMSFLVEDDTGRNAKQVRAVLQAMTDLDSMGMLEQQDFKRYFKFTQSGRLALRVGLSSGWGRLVRRFLEPQQLEVLVKLVDISQEDNGSYVWLRNPLVVELAQALGGQWTDPEADRAYFVLRELKAEGYVVLGGGFGAITCHPTYVGCVRATREHEAEGHALIQTLLVEWESVNVDFKRQLDLNTKQGKAEFVKDILSLTNTKFTGERYMVLGFDNDEPHDFVQSVDTTITQDRMEDILNAYTEPVPSITYRTVKWGSGTAGIIVAKREPYNLPYCVKVDLPKKITPKGKVLEWIRKGDVFVRHGSRVQKAEGQELDDLIAEGKKAKARGE
jgi:hypothetical protein